ncbi:MAG TPA: hypothetical protein PK409_09335 [Thermosynergistes sp.]|nr:hypothetical protein [Thermosynergistes sp.]HQE22118.1 hypothetical protein [Thermosynergistes sp.]
MSKLIGTGILKKDGQEQKVQVCLNLDDNVIEVYQIIPFEERLKKLKTFSQPSNNINLQGITLMNVRLISPMGIIKTDHLRHCFVSALKMGGFQHIESEILNVMDESDFTKNKITFKPYCPKIQFNFDPFVPNYPENRCYEIIYDGAKNMNLVEHINIHLNSDHQLTVSGDNGRFIVKSRTPLSDYEEIIRIGLGILLGGPISVRYIYDGESKTITINLANHEGKTIGPLYRNSNGEELLNKIFKYLFHAKLVGDNRADSYDNNWKRLTRGLHFYLQGLGGIAPIEIRVINLFTFLEIIDESNTLDKNKISKLLDITTDEADILCKTRGSLIHNGKDIATALINSYNEIASYKKAPLDCKLFIIDSDNKQKTTEHFYFKLAMLLNKFLMKEIGYSGQWNDYFDYLNTENNECDSH